MMLRNMRYLMGPSPSDEIMTKEKVVKLLERGNLGGVIEAYEKDPETRKHTIPRTGDTALHVAISDGCERYAERMIECAENSVLKVVNNRGDTALHLAAKFGNAYLCKLIAVKDVTLIGVQNVFGETPLFSAVTHGSTEAFLNLQYFSKCRGYGSYASTDGDTILHSAISGQHFDLAYIIIEDYPDLVKKVNKEKLSALHLLATKSSAFSSGVHLSAIHKLVYHYIRVQKLAEIPNRTEAPSPKRQDSLTANIKMILQHQHLDHRFELETIEDEAINIPMTQVGRSKNQQDEEAANGQDSEGMEVSLHHISSPFHRGSVARCISYFWKCLRNVSLALLLALLLPFLFLIAVKIILPEFVKYIFDYARVKRIKERSIWSVKVMNKIIPKNSENACDQMLAQPPNENVDSPVHIAAKHGILEMVLHILGVCPEAIHRLNAEDKNVVMLAVEHRHPGLYEELIKNWSHKKIAFEQVDKDGNSLLHIAANVDAGKQFWRIRGAALHMQMEIKWYKFIKKSMPAHFFVRLNKKNQTAKQIFQESHRHLIEEGRYWLTSTSQSCSVVAALIATVAFATSATVPGGLNEDNGVPSLKHKPIFIISAASSLIALSSSMISVVMFLGILTSSFKPKDFRKDLPYKLLLGLISLLISIISMFISFYAGHYFVLKHELKQQATLVYTLLCVPMVFFIIKKFPLNFEVVWTTLRTKPHN